MSTQTTALAAQQQKINTLRDMLTKHKDQLEMALPRHPGLTADRMIRVAITAMTRIPDLLECEPRSVAGCLIQSALLGLEPDGVLGQAYLVPFNRKVKGRGGQPDKWIKECQLIPGYQGLLQLARNSGDIKFINAQTVCQNDRFEFEEGMEPFLVHKRSTGDRGPVVAYWAGAALKSGGMQFIVMMKGEVEAHRDKYSKSATLDRSPWKSNFDEMAIKTCLRKLCKLLPKSVHAQIALSLDERHESGLSQQFSVDVPLELQPPPEESADDQLSGGTEPLKEPQRKVADAKPPAKLYDYADWDRAQESADWKKDWVRVAGETYQYVDGNYRKWADAV